jgi:MFS family permease
MLTVHVLQLQRCIFIASCIPAHHHTRVCSRIQFEWCGYMLTRTRMGHTASSSQALSAPPYLVAFVVVLITAYLSDRLRNRSMFVCFHGLLAAAGYALIAIAGWLRLNPNLRYLGVYPATSGFFSAITIIICWTINLQPSDSKKGAATVILQFVGQCGPLFGTRLYPDQDKPYYIKGMLICSGFMILVSCLSLALKFILGRENKRLDLREARLGAPHDGNSGYSTSKEFRYLT